MRGTPRRTRTSRPRSRTPPADRAATRARTRRHRPPRQAGGFPSWIPHPLYVGNLGCPNNFTSAVGGRTVCLRNRKQKCRAGTVIRLGPELAAMALDDGAAHGEADAHAVALGGVERVEQSLEVLRLDADAGVSDQKARSPLFLRLKPDQQM